jgi:prepilin-type N-terminal cleavage/methylation domain-containing protein
MWNKQEKGFTLLELLISIFILSVGILGAYVAIQKSASIASYSYSRLMAAYLAQEGIEIVRNMKDTNLLREFNGISTPWNTDLESENYQVVYSDVTGIDRTPRTCSMSCEFDDLISLRRDSYFYDYNSSIDTNFRRKVTVERVIDAGEENILKVVATVYWKDGTKIREFKVWDKFYNWW